ncbi:MAG: universal stress protein [Nitrosopumilaceae archaeon]
MYERILVPHAGTSGGDDALKHAIHIAKSNSSRIIVLHVVEDVPHAPVLALHSSQMRSVRRKLKQVTRSIKQKMEDEMSKRTKLCEKEGIRPQLKITTGNPAEEILKIVKNQKIDLIVMAERRKLRGIKSLLKLGSVSRKILENVSCPVLIISINKK